MQQFSIKKRRRATMGIGHKPTAGNGLGMTANDTHGHRLTG